MLGVPFRTLVDVQKQALTKEVQNAAPAMKSSQNSPQSLKFSPRKTLEEVLDPSKV